MSNTVIFPTPEFKIKCRKYNFTTDDNIIIAANIRENPDRGEVFDNLIPAIRIIRHKPLQYTNNKKVIVAYLFLKNIPDLQCDVVSLLSIFDSKQKMSRDYIDGEKLSRVLDTVAQLLNPLLSVKTE